ncbi:MAG TPA: TA system VapC family ribonuclease toxin [Gemmataceae bacterium]|nr:TA system VapC family ribonuclease toxin [Gemmataceae bacterium]
MASVSEIALVDTNVLVYALFPAMPDHAASRALLDRAKASDANLCVAPQNRIEFFAVVTDPKRVTQAKTPDEALQAIDDFLNLPGLALILVPSDLISRWSRLMRQSSATRKRAFDTQLAATMIASGVMTIYTFNVVDFQPFAFAGIQAVTP